MRSRAKEGTAKAQPRCTAVATRRRMQGSGDHTKRKGPHRRRAGMSADCHDGCKWTLCDWL